MWRLSGKHVNRYDYTSLLNRSTTIVVQFSGSSFSTEFGIPSIPGDLFGLIFLTYIAYTSSVVVGESSNSWYVLNNT